MPLLSGQDQRLRPPRLPRTAKARPAPPIAVVETCIEARLGGQMVVALPEGALWIESARALVVSDLHLEKGSCFAKGGQMLPPYDTHATLTRLAALMKRLAPDIVVSLGDSFHDPNGVARMAPRDRALLHTLIGACDWIWVEGNHDGKSPETLGGVVRDVLRIGAITLRHEPLTGVSPGEVAGHLHPCAKVVGRGRAVRRRCFAYDGERMVMPAFGAFTGGLNLRDEAFAPIFPEGAMALVMSNGRVLPAPLQRLAPDVY